MDSEQKFTVETEIIFDWELEATLFLNSLTHEQQIMLLDLVGRFIRKRSGAYGFILKHEGKDVYGEIDIVLRDDGIYHIYNVIPITLDEYLDLKENVL